MSQGNRTTKVETGDEVDILEKFLDHLATEYGISKDIIVGNINIKDVKYNLERYKCEIKDVDDFIEASAMNNNHEKKEIIDITQGIKDFISGLEKSNEENMNNRNINLNSKSKKSGKNKNVSDVLNQQPKGKNNPAKSTNISIKIDSKININYSSSIVYNEGENKMETKFNLVDLFIDPNELKMVEDYNLLPKDNSVERDGYENYFQNFKNNLLTELNINQDDPLLGETKFVLFIAFDIIDAKPSYEYLIGIDPLNDYKKYSLKIDQNDSNMR